MLLTTIIGQIFKRQMTLSLYCMKTINKLLLIIIMMADSLTIKIIKMLYCKMIIENINK